MKVLVTGKNGQLGWELSQTQTTATSPEVRAAEVLFVGSEELDITEASSVDQLVNEFQPDVVPSCPFLPVTRTFIVVSRPFVSRNSPLR